MSTILRLAASAPFECPALLEAVAHAYRSPARAYHDLKHLEELADAFDWVASSCGWREPHEVFVALLFHDVVLVPGARDNEEQSAQLALRVLPLMLEPQIVDATRVAELIRWTARHGEPLSEASLDPDVACFLDADLAILGASNERFDEYDRGIAAEYAKVLPPEVFARERRAFFERLLALPHIYHSPIFRQRLEARARENVRRTLDRLSGTPVQAI